MSCGYDVQFMFWFPQSNGLSLIINIPSVKHNNILNPTIKRFILYYKYTEPSTNSSSFRSKSSNGYTHMYTSVHSDVSWKSYSFELFDLPLDVPLV